MKRLGLILLILPIFSAAEVVVPVDSVENNVNIRMSPDAKSEIVGKLNQGDWLRLVSSEPGWHEVEIAGGATGFISADWTNVLAEPPAGKEQQVADTSLDDGKQKPEEEAPAGDEADAVTASAAETPAVEQPAQPESEPVPDPVADAEAVGAPAEDASGLEALVAEAVAEAKEAETVDGAEEAETVDGAEEAETVATAEETGDTDTDDAVEDEPAASGRR